MSKTHSFSKRSFGVFWFSTEKLDENIKYAKMMSADVLCDHFIVVLYEVLGQKSIDWQLSECFCTRVQTKTQSFLHFIHGQSFDISPRLLKAHSRMGLFM